MFKFNRKWFEYLTYGQQYLSVIIAFAMVSSEDAMFRKYDNKTVDLSNSSGQTVGTHTFSGKFIWIHFNVFAGAWALLTMTGLYIYAFIRKHWHGYHTVIVHFLNWIFFLIGFVLISANMYGNSFCNSLEMKVKTTFCTMPKVVLAALISTWVLFCVTLGYEIYCLRRPAESTSGVATRNGVEKQGEMIDTRDLGQGDAGKVEIA